jgi:hypothetical protein
MTERITKHDMDLGYYVDENSYEEERWHSNISNRDIFVIQGDAVTRLAELENMAEEDKFVEVVRCKDCRFYEESAMYFESGYYCAEKKIGNPKETDYCSYGLRRE